MGTQKKSGSSSEEFLQSSCSPAGVGNGGANAGALMVLSFCLVGFVSMTTPSESGLLVDSALLLAPTESMSNTPGGLLQLLLLL